MESTEEMQASKSGFRDYVKALEVEKQKIQVFQRELPLCLELVTQAIERCKQQLSDSRAEYMNGQSDCSEQTSSEGHVFEEFIPLKRTASSDSDNDEELEESDHHINDKDNSNGGDKKKSDWLRSVQLWNTTPDAPQKEELPRKALVTEVKRNGGAFQPFHREKSTGKTNGAVTKSRVSAPATSSTTDTVSGGGGGNSRKEDKDGQRKQRRNWSPELHRRFLNALQLLGGSHTATPKQIRELMKVDGLTNDEVKSHLQKYRLHTRRPTPTIHNNNNNNNNNNNAQAPQFVVVGGIWVPPQDYNAAVAAANTVSGEAARAAAAGNRIYAPVASTPSTVTHVSPSTMHRPRVKKPDPSSHSEERASHSGEGRDQSNSTATSPSSTDTPGSPPAI